MNKEVVVQFSVLEGIPEPIAFSVKSGEKVISTLMSIKHAQGLWRQLASAILLAAKSNSGQEK